MSYVTFLILYCSICHCKTINPAPGLTAILAPKICSWFVPLLLVLASLLFPIHSLFNIVFALCSTRVYVCNCCTCEFAPVKVFFSNFLTKRSVEVFCFSNVVFSSTVLRNLKGNLTCAAFCIGRPSLYNNQGLWYLCIELH